MDWVHVHLLLNHVPVVGTVIAVLVLVAGIVRRDRDVVRVSLWLLVLMALAAVVVYLTGEPTEEAVEGLAGFSEATIERHEEVALVATIIAAMAGLAGLGGMLAFRGSGPFPIRTVSIVLFVALASSVVMAYTANLGGQIRHSEIRGGETIPSGSIPVEAREREEE